MERIEKIAFNTSTPARFPALVNQKGQRQDRIERFLRIENRRICTDLTGWHHAFGLRNLRPTTQPATGIMLRVQIPTVMPQSQ
jgi:hypothetical protein